MQQEARLKLFPKRFQDAVGMVPLMWGLCWPEAPTPLTRSWGAETLLEHLRYSAGLSVVSQFFQREGESGAEASQAQVTSPIQLFMTPWTAACQASLSFTISWSLLSPLSQ